MKSLLWMGVLWVGLTTSLEAQTKSLLVSGPMVGNVETRSAKIWAEFPIGTQKALVKYWKQAEPKQVQSTGLAITSGFPFAPTQVELGGLEPGTAYQYQIWIDGKQGSPTCTFTTKVLWQFRTEAPDFTFLTGSCTYFNEPIYDRPGKPYGGDSSIFLTMAQDPAAFMLWLGDNWYTREVDYHSAWGLWYRAHRDRSLPVLQPLLQNMAHYAIWDDHDFGPNDAGGYYGFKDVSRTVFSHYWANPYYGEEGKGIYSKFSYSDVDFFLLDDRTWRSEDNLPTTVNGQPNPDKRMLGPQQMKWLKESLRNSTATFKMVVVGSQVLNPVSPFDKLLDFPIEHQELIDFISNQKISGVVFLTGDRHHTEIIRVERPGHYPLYDITVSPLTSGTHVFGKAEQQNPYRVLGIDQKQNYGKIRFSGKPGNRMLQIELKGIKGEILGNWEIQEKALKDQ
jgi:alkaline phosphatase D